MKTLCSLIFLISVNMYAQGGHLIPNPIKNIPKWVRTEFSSQGLDLQYEITYQLYPPYLKGDFNGDKKKDIAILVQEKSSGKFGVALFHGKEAQAFKNHVIVLGAGKPFGTAGDDLKWMNIWSIFKQGKSSEGAKESNHPPLQGTAIKIQKRGGGNGLIYWNGIKYEWFRFKQ